MKFLFLIFFVSGCSAMWMDSCRRMCPNGVKSYADGKCECLSAKDFKGEAK
jgi:hypothetical protein